MEDKSKQIQKMFDDIAPKYDMLNRVLSFRRDVAWRRKSIKLLGLNNSHNVLDVACGTGDMIIELKSQFDGVSIVGTDFSYNMLTGAKKKLLEPLVNGDAHSLPFKDNSFDKIMIAFGFRNVTDKDKGLREFFRVLKSGGTLCILEFSQPEGAFFSQIYKLYFTKILPFIGGLISGNRQAYEYLPDSVYKFPKKEQYSNMILNAGFKSAEFNYFTFGICNAAICTKE